MHICFISGEIFAFGKYGGFGRATRVIGSELVKRNHQVSAIVPRRNHQKPIEELDGITVYSFPKTRLDKAARLYHAINADVYHSQEPSFGTWLAQRVRPHAKHVVTCRDARGPDDWVIEQDHPTISRLATRLTRIYEYNPLVSSAVRRADYTGCAAHIVGEKARQVYGLDRCPDFLPTPIPLPNPSPKAEKPTVCFLSRWDARKRPELFFDLAPEFPDVRFIAAGLAHDPRRDADLRTRYGNQPNLDLLPLLNQFEDRAYHDVLSKSWIMVNTALREGLPNSFMEAASYGCAVLGGVNPDSFCSRFGDVAREDDFAGGLNRLLEGNTWKERGQAGRNFVANTFEKDNVLNLHLDIYNRVVSTP